MISDIKPGDLVMVVLPTRCCATRDAFRAGVAARIGLARVEALEADSLVTKWTRGDLVEIKKNYQRKKRYLLRES